METPKIYTAICNIINDIGAIGKNKRSQQGFQYRGIDDVMNALQPLLAKHKVFVVPTVLEQQRSEKQTKSGGTSFVSIFKIKYTFYAEDGSFIESVTIGEAADTGDKGSNKSMAIAFKYALFQVFCIPTEEMPDPDAHDPEIVATKKPAAKSDDTKQQDTLTPEQLNEFGDLVKNDIDPVKAKDRLKELVTSLGYRKLSEVKQSEYDKLKNAFIEYGLPFSFGEDV